MQPLPKQNFVCVLVHLYAFVCGGMFCISTPANAEMMHLPAHPPPTTDHASDIENSTWMWEMLPEEVADRALSLHNDIMRSLLSKYKGYECGTEVML